jgi:hypothetical protein
MVPASILVILPDDRIAPHYLRAFAADGYFIHAVRTLSDALIQLSFGRYDLIVFDIDDELPGTALNTIASVKLRSSAPLVVQGSPLTLAQLLAEFSQRNGENSAPLEADALVIKSSDITELRITVRELAAARRTSSESTRPLLRA